VKTHFYSQAAAALRAELSRELPRELLVELHTRVAWRHLLIAVRQFAILGLATWGLIHFTDPLIWIPVALVQGLTIFDFTILLHEVVHHAVFARPRPRWERFLAYLYAVPSGMAASQFTRWHLDHHAELGSAEDDPKRHRLSPKVNTRWYKLLYCTPLLFPIYFRAALREVATYPPDLQRRIAAERRVTIGVHLLAVGVLWWTFGPGAYDIDPRDPARWATLMRGHWFWDFAFLNSNYHLEHHYFPGVPFYRLPKLQRALVPFYRRHGMRWHGYGELLYRWFVLNERPHTNWDHENETSAVQSVVHS
jgi:fatty acid desaturase